MRVSEQRLEKEQRIQKQTSLKVLVGHVDRLELIDGRAKVIDKLPAPVDEHGIPRVTIMLRELFGQMATSAYVWTGRFDLHHMATPRADYTAVSQGVGAQYRGISQLKVDVPRLMHNLAHELFLTQRHPPHITTMRQALTESEQLGRLARVVGDDSALECVRLGRVHALLEDMKEPQVDIMPSKDVLASLPFDDLRCAVQSLTRVRRYDNASLIHPAIRPKKAARCLVG